jgi:hypothetical protein
MQVNNVPDRIEAEIGDYTPGSTLERDAFSCHRRQAENEGGQNGSDGAECGQSLFHS